MAKLTAAEVDEALTGVPEWHESGDTIQRTFQLKDFVQAIEFVNRIAAVSEAANHHPDLLIRYSRVTLTLATHDAGGITEKDFDLAKKADALHTAMVPPGAVKKKANTTPTIPPQTSATSGKPPVKTPKPK